MSGTTQSNVKSAAKRGGTTSALEMAYTGSGKTVF